MAYKWLLFCPQLPATPSSPRVTVWRRMRSAGAAGLDNGIWVLPQNQENEKLILEMETYVGSQKGECKLFVAETLDKKTEETILERFSQDRAAEYAEVIEQCEDFLAELDKESKGGKFSFAEYEENEADLNKLESWFLKVSGRDFLKEDSARKAAEWLEKCRTAFKLFAEKVYAREQYLSAETRSEADQ